MKICLYLYKEVMILMGKKKISNESSESEEKLLSIESIASKDGIKKHEKSIWKMVELFVALSDPTRVKILLLLIDGEKSVGRLAKDLDMSSSRVSYQLRILKHLNLVKRKREGKFIKYFIADEHVIEVLNVAFYHVAEYMEL